MNASSHEFSSFYRWVVSGLALVIFKLIVDRVLSVRTAFAKVKDSPGRAVLWLEPFSPLALMLGTRFPRSGMCGHYAGKFSLYKKFGVTSFASVLVSSARPFLWLADPEAIAVVTSDRQTFQKDLTLYGPLNIYGGNIISTNGPDWKRHRLVAKSAFNEANTVLVWSETLRIIHEWLEQLAAPGSDVTVDLLPSMTKVTLFLIAAAGFGKRMSWTTASTMEQPPGCKFTFQFAIVEAVDNILIRAMVPGWFQQISSVIKVPYLSSRVLLSRSVFDDLRTHMLDLIASAHAEIVSGERLRASGTALLRNLVEANMNQDEDSRQLTEGEVLSDIFTFLLAGHETTAHTLCFAFILLALYQDCQQKLYEEVTHMWPADVPVTQLATNYREYMDKLAYTSAFIRETLRLFPAEPRLPKEVRKDTLLPGTYFVPGSERSSSVEAGKFVMAVPAGSIVVIDIWALHMNPLHWGEDAEEFKPERFIDTPSYQWPRNAFLPFSGGARSCIGQQFAFTEMVGIITSIVRQYQIQVPDYLVNKPFEEQKEILLKWRTGTALTPSNACVKLCQRA